jgi:hypothetical protein
MARVHLSLSRAYAIYVDYTIEPEPRPYYVGKGTEGRVNKRYRSKLHQSFIKRFGLNRHVVFETDDELEVYAKERELITKYQTYAFGGEGWWGANQDLGGQGGRSTPKTALHRERIRNALKGRAKSSEHCQAMSRGGRGKILTKEHRKKIGEAGKGRAVSGETRTKLVACNQRRWKAWRSAQALCAATSEAITSTSDVNR